MQIISQESWFEKVSRRMSFFLKTVDLYQTEPVFKLLVKKYENNACTR